MKSVISRRSKVAAGALLLIGLLTVGSNPVLAQRPETIEVTATGTSYQMGENVGIRLTIVRGVRA